MPPYSSIDGRQNAPYATVRLLSPDIKIFGNFSYACKSLLDTGSEQTYVPDYMLNDMGLTPSGEAEDTIGFGGGVATYYPYVVTVVLNETTLQGVKVFGWEKTTALIGRNILDSLHICFDGRNFYFQ